MQPIILRFLQNYPIDQWFKKWDPQLTGSYLMGLEIETSDIDFSFLAENMDDFVIQVRKHLGDVEVIHHGHYVECIKIFEGKPFSLFAPKNIEEILVIRHQYNELHNFVKTLNAEDKNLIRDYKRQGMKTPAAIETFKKLKKHVDK